MKDNKNMFRKKGNIEVRNKDIKKEYITPKIKKIGGINEMTLAGGLVEAADSGSIFNPS